MKLTKKIFALLALVFALVAVTACSSNSSSGKSTAKARTIEEIRRVVSFVSPSLRTRNLSVM